MADENQVEEPSAEELKEAEELGWADKDSWKGDPEKWVDAKTFLDRGRHILPIVRDQNKRMKGELSQVTARLSTMEQALRSANATIAALEESQEEDVRAQVEASRKELKEELVKASRDGDHEGVAELTDKLAQLKNSEEDVDEGKVKGKNRKEEEDTTPRIHPEIIQWFKDNPDFTNNKRKIALGNAIAEELRKDGETATGREFMDMVATEVDKSLGTGSTRRGTSKVEPDNGGTGRRGGGGGGGSKTYTDLPADAKAACDRMAGRLVGENRAHKTIDSWRKSYATKYFQQEQR